MVFTAFDFAAFAALLLLNLPSNLIKLATCYFALYSPNIDCY